MKRQLLFIFIMAFSLHSVMIHAQDREKTGCRFWDAIPVMFAPGQTTFTDTRNTLDYSYYFYEYHSPYNGKYQRTEVICFKLFNYLCYK